MTVSERVAEIPYASHPGAGGAPRRRTEEARRLGRIDIHVDPAGALEPWAELEDACHGTLYQTRRFLLPWIETCGKAAGLTPMIVVAHDAAGRPVCLLPFGIARRGPVNVAGFLGGADSNANLGLFRPGVAFSPPDLRSLLRAAAAKTRPRPDVFLLVNQPEVWTGVDNPLDIFPHQPSASFSHRTQLLPDPAAFQKAHLSKDYAKKLRQKRKKLGEIAPVTHRVARGAEDARAILAAFFAQKHERFRQKGLDDPFSSEAAHAFLDRATLAATPAIELHALLVGDRIVAVFGGGEHRGHFHGMFNSFDLDAEVARSSPGDLLLQSLLDAKCREGVSGFDLGIGEARYKSIWCPVAEPLFDSILAVTPLGQAFAWAESGRRHVKRAIKQSEWAWPLLLKMLGRA